MSLELLKLSFFSIIKGVPVTLGLVIISTLVGFIIAITINIFKNNKVFSYFSLLYVFFFRGTPLFLQLFLIYYGVGQFFTEDSFVKYHFLAVIFKEAYIYALLALTLNTGAYGSEIIRGSLKAVKIGQIEAARAMGFSNFLIYKRIIFPQVFYYSLPAYSNEIILLVKASSLASLVTIMDITGYLNKIRSDTYSFAEPFIVAAGFYLLINFVFIKITSVLENKAKVWMIK